VLGQLLSQSRAPRRESAGDLDRLDASRLTSSIGPALDGGAGALKNSDISILEMPRSRAESVVNGGSFEYAFIESILMQVR